MDEIERAVWIDAGFDPGDPQVVGALEILKLELWWLASLCACTTRDDR